MVHWRRKLMFVLAGLGILALLVLAFLPTPVEADLAAVTRGRLRVTVDREGKTRIRERYVVSTPLAGRLQRIDLRPGDRVQEGATVLAVIEPGDPALLDARALAEAEARVKAAEEAHKLAEADLLHARKELDRERLLLAGRGTSRREFDLAEYKERAAAFAVKIADYELELARAALVRSRPPSPGEAEKWRFPIRSPISGCVLEVFQESARTIAAGDELLKVGDPNDLECVIDVLSPDGVKVRQALKALPAVKVLFEHWGGEEPLHGRVRLVEPAGFTKISALGVEEQRVNVVADFTDPLERRQTLGDAFRVEARIILWEEENVLKIPSGALFRSGDGWAVFRVRDGRAVLHPVRIGRNNGLEAQVLEGLEEGDQVVVHPSDRIRDGIAVQGRSDGR